MPATPGGTTGYDGVEWVVRRAARVLVVNARSEVLLLAGGDPAAPHLGTWWFTPGGGLEGDEDEAAAARRELREETGCALGDLGPVVHRHHSSFDLIGTHFEQDDAFFVARVEGFEVDSSGQTALERRLVLGHRWWSEHELATTTEVVFPEGLLAVLRRVGVFGSGPGT